MGVVEIHELDYSSHNPVKGFLDRVAELQRLDTESLVRLLNSLGMSKDNEDTITVNLISTVPLTLFLIPILRSPAFK